MGRGRGPRTGPAPASESVKHQEYDQFWISLICLISSVSYFLFSFYDSSDTSLRGPLISAPYIALLWMGLGSSQSEENLRKVGEDPPPPPAPPPPAPPPPSRARKPFNRENPLEIF